MKYEWRVDEIGEESAAVESGGKLMHVPRWLLPASTRENDVVVIEISEAAEERRVILRVDASATRAAMEASRRQVRSTPSQNDPGGPIKL